MYMAWITVDQKLIGGKLRDFAKRAGISQNEAIGILIRLWLWGIDNAEENGKIVAGDITDVEEAIRPGFLDPENSNLNGIVHSMIDSGWIDKKANTLYIHDWLDWRSYYNNYVDKKKKHAERMRNYREEKKNDIPQDPEPVQEAQKRKNPYTEGFEAFWKVYPRKIDKGNAYKKYKARLNAGFSEAELLEASENYRKECDSEKRDPKYIKHATTFLSDAMPFLDYIKTNNPEQKTEPGKAGNPFL